MVQAVLDALQHGGVHDKLEHIVDFSLQQMPVAQQGMFLDVAAVLIGQQADTAQLMWRAWHGDRAVLWFQQLQSCCLVEVDYKGLLQMHDLISARGRTIVLDSSWGNGKHFGSRVWCDGGKMLGYQKVKTHYWQTTCIANQLLWLRTLPCTDW
jgi:hypothetical protein